MLHRFRSWFAALLALALVAACGSSSEIPLERAAEIAPADDPEGTDDPDGSGDASAEPADAAPVQSPEPDPEPDPQPPTTAQPEPVDVHSLVPPEAATDPEGLARQIADAEVAVRDPESSDAEVAGAALALQVAYRQLGKHPGWDDAVLAALPPELHMAASHNAAARREFQAMHSRLGENLPGWAIVEPAPAEQLLAWYREAEAEFGVPWPILAAVNLVETGMGRIRGLSVAGARGPMQFMPATWDAYGEGDIDDPHDSIRAAARYLAANGGGRGEIDNALFHYNRDNRYVRGVKHYAAVIAEHPRAFLAYYHWGIWYATAHGDIYLPVGYEQPEPVHVLEYLAGA